MRTRRATAIALLACALAAPAADAAPAAPLGHAGRWITDAQGRVVILHGLNVVAKRPPYAPDALGFGADDAEFLARNGLEAVRLGIMYTSVEPSPGVYDDAYIDRILRTQRLLAAAGVFSLIDFHQDSYNERFDGQGFPDWAVQDDGLPSVGYPLAQFVGLGHNRAWDHFWANDPGPGGVGLQDRYAAALRHVAERFRGERHVLGYDVINEPWPGTVWPTCANNVVCPQHVQLAAFYKRVTAAIRQADPEHLVWYEPNLLAGSGGAIDLPALGDPRAGLSFHTYCLFAALGGGVDFAPVCPTLEQVVFDQAQAHSAATGAALLLTEFGSTKDTAVLKRIAAGADRAGVGWMEWTYNSNGVTDFAGTPSLVRDPKQPPRGTNVDADQLRALVRAAPRAVAGTPASFSFDPATREFALRYSTARAGGPGSFDAGALTEITAPELVYPSGYAVEVVGGRVVSAARSTVIRVRSDAGSREVRVRVRPGAGSFPRERARAFSAKLAPRRDRKRPYRFTASGLVTPPEGLRPADACAGTVRVRVGRRVQRVRVGASCRWKARLSVRNRGRARISARFAGNGVLLPSRTRVLRLRAG